MLTVLPMLIQMSLGLPQPSGQYPVGTRIGYFVDSSRPSPTTGKPGREIVVQYWYPAGEIAGRTFAPYLPQRPLLEALVESGYYSQSKEDLRSWGTLSTHAYLDAPLLRSRRWPVLLFEPGLGTARVNYTSYCEEAASRGYFVGAIDPAYGTLTVLKSGKVASAEEDKENEDPANMGKKAREWAGDMSFVLDQIEVGEFASSLSLKEVGAFGHSSGGAAAMVAPRTDKRIRAAVNLDGMMDQAALHEGTPAATLRIGSNPNYSDADLTKLGRTREQWEKMKLAGKINVDNLPKGVASKPIYAVSIRDTGHLSFSDAPFVMPSTITHFSDHPLEAVKTWHTTCALMFSFFEAAFQDKEWSPFAGMESFEGLEFARYR